MGTAVLALFGSVRTATPSEARPTGQAQAPITIQLVSQDATTQLGGTLQLRLRITGSIGAFKELEVRVIAHPSIESLDQLARTTSGDDLGGLKDAVELPLSELVRFPNGDVRARVALQPLGEEFDFTKLNVTEAGVYPLEILVRDENEDELAGTISWLIATESGAQSSIRFAWIWTLAPKPDVEADGVTPTKEFFTSTHEGGELAQFVDAVAASDLPLSLVISPQTLDAWSRAADTDPESATTFERARAALRDRHHELLPVPYVPIDGPSLEAAQLGPRVPASFLEGAQTLQRVLGRRPNTATVFADPTGAASLDRLGETFAYQAIVPADSVRPAAPADLFSLRGDDRSFLSIATRPDLEAWLSDPGLSDSGLSDPEIPRSEPPGHRVQRWLTALALLSAGRESPLPVIFATEPNHVVDRQLLQAIETALTDQTLVVPVPASELFLGPTTSESRELEPAPPSAVSISALEVIDAERTLDSFVSFVGDDHPAVVAQQANLRLVVARDIPAEAMRARLAALNAAVSQFVSGIGTESKQVTLTDRRSIIPLTFRNDTGREVRVRVTLSSSKLAFPDKPSKTIVLPPGRNTQETFEVEARASGKFTMTVSITSADGNLAVGSPTLITVSSAVFGSIGTWLTFGALGFLALWWAHHFWRARRRT